MEQTLASTLGYTPADSPVSNNSYRLLHTFYINIWWILYEKVSMKSGLILVHVPCHIWEIKHMKSEYSHNLRETQSPNSDASS